MSQTEECDIVPLLSHPGLFMGLSGLECAVLPGQLLIMAINLV